MFGFQIHPLVCVKIYKYPTYMNHIFGYLTHLEGLLTVKSVQNVVIV